MTKGLTDNSFHTILLRIAEALERVAPSPTLNPDFSKAEAFIWYADQETFEPVPIVEHVPLQLLKGIEMVADQLMVNTKHFCQGLQVNNALLWGARGMGKSSLVKAVHAEVIKTSGPKGNSLKLVEVKRDDIQSLARCLKILRNAPFRFILFFDDLSFDKEDKSYKFLKALLEGGIEGRPQNVVFYATSNRRHLISREMIENENATALTPSEAVEEKVSLSDRFGLWLGFHNCTQDQYLTIVKNYANYYGLTLDQNQLEWEALEWSMSRGARSGRVAWQFILELAGKLEVNIDKNQILS